MLSYRNMDDFNKCIVANLHKIPPDVGLVVGIPRDGMIAASLIAAYLNLPLSDLNSFIRNAVYTDSRYTFGKFEKKELCPKVLIVDDFINFGNTIKRVKEELMSAKIDMADIVFLSVYAASHKKAQKVDLYFEVVPMHRFLEWNVIHHPLLRKACVDIDGVLCRNPTKAEDDDGENYSKFMREVEPYINPGYSIGYLVTCRLEKYRDETIAQLERYGISYKRLIMMDLPNKEARAKVSRSGYKAKIYEDTNALLFVESSSKQAKEIADKTGKPVFCITDHKFYNSREAKVK